MHLSLFSRINILFSFKFCIIIVFYLCLNYFEVSETLIIGFVLIFMRLFQIYQTYPIILVLLCSLINRKNAHSGVSNFHGMIAHRFVCLY